MGKRGNNEGSIGQRKDGRWYARATLTDGRRVGHYAKTRQEAAAWLAEALRDAGRGLPVTGGAETVGAFLDRWLEESVRPRLRRRTYLSYEAHIRCHLRPALGRIRLSHLTPGHVQKMMNDLQAAGLSPATVQRTRSTLRAALSQAEKWGDVQRNVAKLVTPPKAAHRDIVPMSFEEARQLLEAVRGTRDEALYALALATGLRRGEILGLTWRDVALDTEPPTLRVRQALQRVDSGQTVLVEPKSKTSRRTIVLPAALAAQLRAHRTRQRREQLALGVGWSEDGFVFTTTKGTPLDGSEVTRKYHRVLAAAGLPRRRFHDLRHACASFMLAQGASPREVMDQLGHSGIAITMDTYAHLLPELRRESAARMNDALFGADAGHERRAEPGGLE